MNAEVIAIGDELTSGQRLDTNSQLHLEFPTCIFPTTAAGTIGTQYISPILLHIAQPAKARCGSTITGGSAVAIYLFIPNYPFPKPSDTVCPLAPCPRNRF